MVKIHPYTGPKIRFYRKLQSLALRELARRSGVNWGLIGRYENRKTAPQYEKVGHIAKALDVPLEHLWDHTPPPKCEPPSGNGKPKVARAATRQKK